MVHFRSFVRSFVIRFVHSLVTGSFVRYPLARSFVSSFGHSSFVNSIQSMHIERNLYIAN